VFSLDGLGFWYTLATALPNLGIEAAAAVDIAGPIIC
jgi:hypothetical protein